MPKVVANGIKLHYLRVGDGPDVVMLHGLTGNLAVWHLKIARILESDLHITTYDLRGHGFSDMPPTGYSTREMAEDLKGLLDALNIDRTHLVGHSYGADIALQFALLYPGWVNRIVAIEPGLAALAYLRKREDWEGWKFWREGLAQHGIEVPHERWADPEYLFKLTLKVPKFFGPAIGRTRNEEPFLRLLNDTTVSQDYEAVDGFTLDRVEEITAPTLLIYGESSAYLETWRCLRDHLPHSESALLPRSELGHFGPLEQPNLVAQHIKGFLFKPAETLTPNALSNS